MAGRALAHRPALPALLEELCALEGNSVPWKSKVGADLEAESRRRAHGLPCGLLCSEQL